MHKGLQTRLISNSTDLQNLSRTSRLQKSPPYARIVLLSESHEQVHNESLATVSHRSSTPFANHTQFGI
ncbi:hypothetical protein LguiA_033157 [Lonicera macranthoides]